MQLQVTGPADNSNRWFRDSWQRLMLVSGGILLLTFWTLAGTILVFQWVGNSSTKVAGFVVAGYSVMSGLAALSTWRSRGRSSGLEARTWRNITLGLAAWTFGGIAYIVYLMTGGDPKEPTAWSQVGYIVAYLPWYFALWQLRQPALTSSRRRQFETLQVEAAALLMLSVLVGSILWQPDWPVSHNLAQLVPAITDLLLLATFYGAVRRSNWSRATALTWLGYSFAALAVSDILMTLFVEQGHVLLGGAAASGYVVAMALIVLASSRPLRVAELQNRVRGTTGIVAAAGLTLSGMAVVVSPQALRPVAVIAGIILAWRTMVILSERDNSDSDPLTGFLESRAFERHLGGVVQLASTERPGLLLVVDLSGFGAWNARNGYAAGDRLLMDVAKVLESNGPNATAWGRLRADRFAVTTVSHGAAADRAQADLLQRVASKAAAPLTARAAIVELPRDASAAAEALDAADEALRAGSAGGRSVVAYSSGGMDGLSPVPGYASLGTRREKIQALIASTESIQIVLQPIVHIEQLTICGFEALSRFHTDPRHGPDEWISEATLLGLGTDLEIECARRAWRRRDEIGGVAHIAINLSPEAIMSETLADAIDSEDLTGLVVEITEHERVLNYPRLAARLAGLRGRGAKIAVDDMGAGHASLSHLIELKPDFIKLDRKLVTGLDLEPGKHALVRNMLRLSHDLGASLIAEGIETMGELMALRELGVPLGQGYFLGRPTVDTDEHFERLAAAAALRTPSYPMV